VNDRARPAQRRDGGYCFVQGRTRVRVAAHFGASGPVMTSHPNLEPAVHDPGHLEAEYFPPQDAVFD
jgi:hypothetical protein